MAIPGNWMPHAVKAMCMPIRLSPEEGGAQEQMAEETTAGRKKLQETQKGTCCDGQKKVPKRKLWHKSCRITPASAHERRQGESHPFTGWIAKDAARLAALPFLAASSQNPLATLPLLTFAFDSALHVTLLINRFQDHIESPQAGDMLEHFFRLSVQRPAQVLVVA